MGAFEYQALDAGGRQRKGVLEGDTPRHVRTQLRERGLVPLQIQAVEEREARASRGPLLARGVSATDLALLTRQMATLVRSGLPLEDVLRTVSRQTEKQRLKSLMLAVRNRVLEGYSLAQGLGEFPHVFPDIYRTTVAAGEKSGYLDVVLERLAEYTEGRQRMRQKVQMALFYPVILTLMAIGVTLTLLTYVVPEVVGVFDHIGQDLPLLTQALITTSDFMRDYALYGAIGAIALFLVLGRLFQRPRARYALHALLLRLPLVGRLIRGVNAARFARTLSILTASSVPVLEALRVAGAVVSNEPMRQGVEAAARRVREGSGLASALEQTGYFPPITVHLIASGESGGKLEQMLDRAAENQERELESLTGMFLGLFEPLLILLMGGVVMVIVLAILLPVFELNQLVQ